MTGQDEARGAGPGHRWFVDRAGWSSLINRPCQGVLVARGPPVTWDELVMLSMLKHWLLHMDWCTAGPEFRGATVCCGRIRRRSAAGGIQAGFWQHDTCSRHSAIFSSSEKARCGPRNPKKPDADVQEGAARRNKGPGTAAMRVGSGCWKASAKMQSPAPTQGKQQPQTSGRMIVNAG